MREVIRRGSGPAVLGIRVAEDGSDGLSREDFDLGVVDVAVAFPGVLAGNDALGEERVRELGQEARVLAVAIVEAEPVGALADRLQADHPGRAGADVGDVETELIDELELAAEVGGLQGQPAKEEAFPLADLRAVHVLVALHVDEAVADLDIRDDLCLDR